MDEDLTDVKMPVRDNNNGSNAG